VFRDAEKIAAYNPLRKVPTLVDDDGTLFAETFVCLDVIDERVAERWEALARGRESSTGLQYPALSVTRWHAARS
jgi:glutathione S-transferase